jgi:hypothetical protein
MVGSSITDSQVLSAWRLAISAVMPVLVVSYPAGR